MECKVKSKVQNVKVNRNSKLVRVQMLYPMGLELWPQYDLSFLRGTDTISEEATYYLELWLKVHILHKCIYVKVFFHTNGA